MLSWELYWNDSMPADTFREGALSCLSTASTPTSPTEDEEESNKGDTASSTVPVEPVLHCPTPPPYKLHCGKCGKVLPEKSLKQHEKEDSETSLCACQIRDQSFEHNRNLPRRRNEHLDESNHGYSSPSCRKSSKSRYFLREHKKEHKKLGKLECGSCTRTFLSEAGSAMHQLVHESGQAHACESLEEDLPKKVGTYRHEKRAQQMRHAGKSIVNLDMIEFKGNPRSLPLL